MKRYNHKKLPVDVFQWNGESVNEVMRVAGVKGAILSDFWTGDKSHMNHINFSFPGYCGIWAANLGDYIMRGKHLNDGGVVMKEEHFHKLYEESND